MVVLAAWLGPSKQRDGKPRPQRVPSSDGLSVAYTLEGEDETTLVFVHGWACDRFYWSGQRAAFARTRQVVTIDLGGHGESGQDRQAWTLRSLAGDVVAVLEKEQLRDVILIGHSMGGPVALLAARKAPQRVIGVIAVDSLHDVEASDPEQQEAYVAAFEADFAGTLRVAVPHLFHPSADPSLVARVTERMAAQPPAIGIGLQKDFMTLDLAGALAAVSVPVRCLNTSPTNAAANRQHARDFDVRQMVAVGHFPMLERPAQFNVQLEELVAEIEAAR